MISGMRGARGFAFDLLAISGEYENIVYRGSMSHSLNSPYAP